MFDVRCSMFDVRCSMFDVRCSMFDVRCSMFDVRCWMFDVRCSMFDVRCSMLDVGCWMFDVGCSMFDVGCWMFDVRCSMLDVGCSMFDVGCSMLLGRRPISAFNFQHFRFQNFCFPPPSPSPIQRTPDTQPRLLHDVRVNLRRRHIFVAEQLLQRPNIITCLQKMRRERMPQRVATRPLVNLRQPHRHLHHPLHTRLIQMMPPQSPSSLSAPRPSPIGWERVAEGRVRD
jgi:hypothetical protein